MARRLRWRPTVRARRLRSGQGFSLVEVLVATTTLLVALAGLAQLFTVSAAATARARALTQAAVFAQNKMESLVPLAAGSGVSTSPANVLLENVSGYCEFLDTAGAVVGTGINPPRTAAFVRRWAIEPIGGATAPTLALSVLVIDQHRFGAAARISTILRAAP